MLARSVFARSFHGFVSIQNDIHEISNLAEIVSPARTSNIPFADFAGSAALQEHLKRCLGSLMPHGKELGKLINLKTILYRLCTGLYSRNLVNWCCSFFS
jgi:hypothetical protein